MKMLGKSRINSTDSLTELTQPILMALTSVRPVQTHTLESPQS